jgi:hypothetical protein
MVKTRPAAKILLFCVVLVATILLLPLRVGVWSPDVLSGRSHLIASQRLSDGSEFRVVQYWNHFDFYTTELRHVFPDGHDESWVLDGDDRKRWWIPLNVDESARTVSVPHEIPDAKTIKW